MIEPSEIAEQFRAHAVRCRQLARQCPDEFLGAEMDRIADDCIASASKCESEPTAWERIRTQRLSASFTRHFRKPPWRRWLARMHGINRERVVVPNSVGVWQQGRKNTLTTCGFL
jgi:hypothetical protein